MENHSKKGMYVNWPTAEAGQVGDGVQASIGVQAPYQHGTPFYYLPFLPNGINYVATEDRDVVSGLFTGCIMAVYRVNGERRVCHVSTGDGQNCRPQWEQVKQAAAEVVEFRPSDAIQIAPELLGGWWGCWGLITADGPGYSITGVGPAGGATVVANQAELEPLGA